MTGSMSTTLSLRVNTMRTSTLRERLQRIKNYAKHSPTQLLSMSMASVAAATLNIALAPGASAYALFMVTGIGLAAVSSTADINNGLTPSFGGLFKNKRRGKKAMLRALHKMQELEFPDAAQTFQYTLKIFNGFQQELLSPPCGIVVKEITTPGGYVFKGLLPDDPVEACDVLVKHAIYMVLTKGPCQPNRDEFLSEKLQRYVLTNHPEWVACSPFLFDPAVTEHVHPGLHEAMVCIRALDYTGDEQSVAIRTWLDSQATCPDTSPSLPDNMVY